MLINPDYLKTSSFVVQGGEPIGTVFFLHAAFREDGTVLHQGESPAPSPAIWLARYAITARHVVKGQRVSIRFNRRGGGTQDEPILPDDWVCHDDTDVAVLPLRFPTDDFDISYLGETHIIKQIGHVFHFPHAETEGRKTFMPYGAGTEVFTVGLFSGHAGQRRARPVVRFGHIALDPAPGEKILTALDSDSAVLTPIDAFLIEVAAWQGQSGSPVFIRPFETTLEQQTGEPVFGASFLIGMLSSSYPEVEENWMTPGGEVVGYKVNAGIAVVVPSVDISKMLDENEALIAERKKLAEQLKKQKAAPRPVRVVGSGKRDADLI